jgi:diaminohydroxyphosphoribosylaminopyrimidine deaminase/5-amino-6-(5-phosphoribosylamino)uracil reductase
MHEQFLLAALEQAKLARGMCAPNPSVGAVAVQNGVIIAQAAHLGAGTHHAEQLVLEQIPPNTPGVKLYITLEPCNHWGKTPPCVNSIIEHGIEEVVFSYYDPNPIVARNNSSAQLREQGVKVTFYPLTVIEEFYKSYTYWIATGKPRVTAKIAQTFDGKIGYAESERVILSNSLCSEFTHQMRAASDIILTTARTIQLDNPRMNVRLHGREVGKNIAIIDRNLGLAKDALIFTTAKQCFIYHQPDVVQKCAIANSNYYSIAQNNGLLVLNDIIAHLGGLGFHDVWVEAGGTLFSALHKEGLVHRTYIYLVPGSLGEKAVSAYQKEDWFGKGYKISWQAMNDNMIACLDWQGE